MPESLAPVVFEPPLEQWPDAGVYQLHLRLSAHLLLTVGRLGRWRLAPGRYVYVGRASRHLVARVRRHLARNKRRHWHIDYLLSRRAVRIEVIRLASHDPADECPVVSELAVCGWAPIPGFGASDCRAGCAAHLLAMCDRQPLGGPSRTGNPLPAVWFGHGGPL